MKEDHNSLSHQARNDYPSGLPHQKDAALSQLIEREQNTILPFPYFYVLYNYEISELQYISPQIEKLYGINRDDIYEGDEQLLFQNVLEDEKPAVIAYLNNIGNVHYHRGKKYVSERVFIIEYHIRRSNGDILHIMYQNEVLSYTEEALPNVGISRFVDMSWLFGEGKNRSVKCYMYNRQANKIEGYTDQKVTEHPRVKLTPREEHVQQLVNHGFTSMQIAKKLDISVETVKTHRKNIKAKQADA